MALPVVVCPYCGHRARLVDSTIVYHKNFGKIWLCFPCDAYCGVHESSNKPLGIIANKELRKLRIKVHEIFDPLWKTGKMTRKEAYKLFSDLMEIPESKTHVGMFTVSDCKKAIKLLMKYKREEKRHERELEKEKSND